MKMGTYHPDQLHILQSPDPVEALLIVEMIADQGLS